MERQRGQQRRPLRTRTPCVEECKGDQGMQQWKGEQGKWEARRGGTGPHETQQYAMRTRRDDADVNPGQHAAHA